MEKNYIIIGVDDQSGGIYTPEMRRVASCETREEAQNRLCSATISELQNDAEDYDTLISNEDIISNKVLGGAFPAYKFDGNKCTLFRSGGTIIYQIFNI